MKKRKIPRGILPFSHFFIFRLRSLEAAGVVGTAVALDELLGGHLTRLAVLDGDGLQSNGRAHGDGLCVQRAAGRRLTAVRGVANLCAVRTAHGHLCRRGERRLTANGRSCYASGNAAAAAAVASGVSAAVAGISGISRLL